MIIDPPKSYQHKEDGTVVQLLEINANNWYCWVICSDGVIRPISEDIFFRDFELIKRAASKS
ncbi:hypothetical protein JFU18_02010 [Bacillus sp. TH22]|uniref:hypothetical protein n=1 Tax=unclassified Bacillus (in: firmicutes) TaxID=185979 RepID=UPI0019126B8C|nr:MULTISPECIES: hypothetical protein [unclassified Bacillus (in: firmicutes)]MBK5447472.1 hypothetical protein [Bacillus sp. TH22]MBK5453668.1 hypothetical protein [Bacillus sp. TH23]